LKQKHPLIVFLLATLNRRRTAIFAILAAMSVPLITGLEDGKIHWRLVLGAGITVLAGFARSVSAPPQGSGPSGSVPSPPADPPVLGNAPDDPPGSPFVDPPR
jgi:hypothetical protein